MHSGTWGRLRLARRFKTLKRCVAHHGRGVLIRTSSSIFGRLDPALMHIKYFLGDAETTISARGRSGVRSDLTPQPHYPDTAVVIVCTEMEGGCSLRSGARSLAA